MRTVTVAAIGGLGAVAVAVWASGAAREVAALVSLYGAFVVVVAGAPGRRAVLRPAVLRVRPGQGRGAPRTN